MFSKCLRQLTYLSIVSPCPAHVRDQGASGVGNLFRCILSSIVEERRNGLRLSVSVRAATTQGDYTHGLWDLQDAVVTYRPKELTLVSDKLAGDLPQMKKQIEDKVNVVVNLKTQPSKPS